MENNYYNISVIIARYIKGECNDNEKQTLDAWLEESEEHRSLFKELLDEDKFREKMNVYESYNLDAAYQNVVKRKESRIHKKGKVITLKKVARYAAAILIPVACISYFVLFMAEDTKELASAEIIPAGSAKAELILSSGERLVLEGNSSDTIKKENALILSQEGILDYSETPKTEVVRLNQLIVPRGGEYSLVLADGTKVWLNSETELSYPQSFTGDTRKVILKGEAYFDVTENKEKPFVVETDDLRVRVLGTEFNVRNYESESNIATTLVEGRVKVASNIESDKLIVTLKPGEQSEYNNSTKTISKRKVDVREYIAWKEGRFVFKHRDLEDVMRELQRWYDVAVVFENESLKHQSVTGQLKRSSTFSEFVKMMEVTGVASFEIENRTITIMEK